MSDENVESGQADSDKASASSKRVLRLKKSEKSEMPEHSEVKESSWQKREPRIWRTTILATVMTTVGLIAYRMPENKWWGILVVFTAALIVGETLELKLIDRPPIPISFAAIVALARTATDDGQFSWIHVSVVMVAATVLSTLCYSHVSILSRCKIFAARLMVFFTGCAIARTFFDVIDPGSHWRYIALIVAMATMLALHEVLAWIDGYPRTYGFFAAAAHASVIAGGVLIGVGYAGTQGYDDSGTVEPFVNGLGISALLTCAIPLLVAWFAFARYFQALMTYKQTIRALSAAPELGGIVAWGHADRVARIALAIAQKLDLDRDDLQQIETASYMHTLGDAVLDTTMEVDPIEEEEAAHVTADIVRSAGGLDRVADIIDDHVRPYRGIVNGDLVAQNDIAASVLRVANDYDNISRRDETWGARALTTMLSAPAATYHPRALEALEWVLSRDKYSNLVNPPEMPKNIQELLNS